jgi:ribose transport system substrate-binding protein
MRVLWKLGWVGLLALLATGLTGGCGSSGKRIIILTNGNSPFWDACRVGLQSAEKDFDLKGAGLRAVLEINDGTPEGQVTKLRQFASQSDIVAIGISACDEGNEAVADELRKLKSKGIHILTIDSDIDRKRMRDLRFAFVGTNNLAGGIELGKSARYLRPEGGEYITFVGRTGAQNAIDRIEGVRQGAGDKFKSDGTMADDTNEDRARINVRNALGNYPKLNTLVGIWSYNAPAIADVVEQKDRRKDFTIVVFDAEPLAIKAMGKGMIDAMVVQNPYQMGYKGVRLMKALVQDDKATIAELLPDLGKPDGDIIDTGLKVVVPDENTPLKRDLFDPKTEFLKLSEFRQWLEKYKLTGS